jgi:hypothetical protein
MKFTLFYYLYNGTIFKTVKQNEKSIILLNYKNGKFYKSSYEFILNLNAFSNYEDIKREAKTNQTINNPFITALFKNVKEPKETTFKKLY